MYRFPLTVDVRSVAPKGCMVTGDGGCGQIKPYHGESECVDRAHDCWKQVMAQKDYESQTATEMREVCVALSLLCVGCGMDNGFKCDDSVIRDLLSTRSDVE